MPAPDETKDRDSERTPSAAPFSRWWLALPLVCLAAVGGYVSLIGAQSGSSQPGPASPAPPVPVLAEAAAKRDVGVYVSGLGSVVPLNTVTVKTRVDGQLMSVLYQEGQTVSRGSLLAQIDPRPFEVQLTQADGQMSRDRALLENARLDLARYRDLWQKDSVSKQQLDTQEALVRQYEGAAKADQGQIDSARLQLTYCRITAPIGGRIGLRLVDPGNIVHASDAGGLVVITQLQPITVVFPIPEDSLPDVLARLKGGGRLPVEVYDRAQKRRLAEGYLLTVDNQIDPQTGTVRLKAVCPNSAGELFPNQFVNVRLRVNSLRGAVVVPGAAIQRGPQGAFVYVVSDGRTARVRPVSLGETTEGATIIKTGLSAGELVVVDGADRLHEGARVEVKSQGGQGSPQAG